MYCFVVLCSALLLHDLEVEIVGRMVTLLASKGQGRDHLHNYATLYRRLVKVRIRAGFVLFKVTDDLTQVLISHHLTALANALERVTRRRVRLD